MTEPLTEPGRHWPGRGRWHPGWKMTLFVALLLPLVIGLGWWQLERAETKSRFESAYLDQISALAYEPGPTAEDFARLKLSGRYDGDRYFLLDNAIRRGQAGYEVLHPLLLDTGERGLVNRGWVAGLPYRQQKHRCLRTILKPKLISLMFFSFCKPFK